jgi:hypothetical protein
VRRTPARAMLAFAVTVSASAAAESSVNPPASPAANPSGDLQSPEQVSTRYSAYSLPARQWSIDAGALGVGDGDVFALLAVTYGLGAGVQLNVNLAHVGVGLLNVSAGWHFIDTRYFDLGARLGAWYGHGEWFWFADPVAKKIVSKIDLVKIPIELIASSTPTRWLELDLGLQYTYATLFGSSAHEESIFTDSELGMQQFFARPGARFFISNATALELSVKLPFYSSMTVDGRSPTVPFKRTWLLEAGLRSRLARGLFGNVRLHYAPVSDLLYGARLYPSFEVEVRP